jgi:outer membrane protein, heavy metal efflux system
VRSNYFAVLVAEESMRANRGLMELTEEIYKVMLTQLEYGQVAAYESAQIGVFAGQARIAYIQSRNSYLESWKLLATSIGLTMMPATQLSGSVTRDLPRFDFEKSLAHVLNNHTDALTALNGLTKARLNLRLQEVTMVPDVTVGAFVFNDNSAPGPPRFVPSLTASVPVPFFDRNQGNIKSAQGALVRAIEQPHATQNSLTASFADAFRRMEENRQILALYRKQLLPQQVQAFRSTVLRHWGIGTVEVGLPGFATAYFGDLIASEQNLVTLIASYLGYLGSYWQAVSDTASLLQTDDAFQMAAEVEQLPEADLREMLKLPCCHPCSTLQHAGQSRKIDFQVPQADLPLPSPAYRSPPAVLPGTPVLPSLIGEQGMNDARPRTSGETVVDSVPAAVLTRPIELPPNPTQPTIGAPTPIDNGESAKGGTR